MGSMSSPADAVQRLIFNPLPEDRVIEGQFVKSRDVIVVRSKRGTLYTNAHPLNKHMHCGGIWKWSEDIFDCLCALKIVPEDVLKQHGEWMRHRVAQKEIQDHLSHAHYSARHKKGGAIRIDQKKLLVLWSKLDDRHKNEAIIAGYAPPGADLGPYPKTST